jgi:cobaltochelatase CobN
MGLVKTPIRSLLLVLALFTTTAVEAAERRAAAVFVLRNSQVAVSALRSAQLQQSCDCLIVNEDVALDAFSGAKVVFLEHPSARFLDRIKPVVLDGIAKRGLQVVTDVPEVVQRSWGIDLPAAIARRLMPYWQNGGEANMTGFFLAAFQEAGGPKDLRIPKPVEQPRTGAYHPEAQGRTFSNLSEYLAWYRPRKPRLGRLAVVTFFPTYLNKRDMAYIDALLLELEGQGLAAAGVFGWPHHTVEKVFQTPEDDPVGVMLSFTLSLSKPEDRALLEKQNVHVIGLMITRDTYEQWAVSERGVTPDRVATSLAEPERNGATDPILVATTEAGPDGMQRTMPIGERVRMAAMRARRWIVLRDKPNHDKRLVMLYYNNPPGKGNIGASYLNIAPSIRNVLETLRKEGYRVGNRVPAPEQILDQLEKTGRNIEAWAPGELTRMLEQGGVMLLPLERYQQWFRELPAPFRRQVNARWGRPEESTLMVWTAPDRRKFFVIPGMRVENVYLGPQLLRSSFAEYTNIQHSGTLPPHHGYVASYLFYRHQLQADAVIHMGRHGTLEWLPGKNAGQAGWDSSEAILGDLPNLNYYIMDGDGEAIQARRRSAAVDLSHLTPMLARTGKEERFEPLAKALAQWRSTQETSPLIAAEYASAAMREIRAQGLDKQLNLTREKDDASVLAKVEEFLEETEEAPIPLGLPTLGVAPPENRQKEGLAAFFATGFLPEEVKRIGSRALREWSNAVFAGSRPEVPDTFSSEVREKIHRNLDGLHDWLRRLRESPDRELAAVVRVLRGEYLTSGLVGDPLGVPDALPSGRNLHQGDPSQIPTRAAWEVGKKLAQQLLDRHRKQHGKYPERLSMVLWQGETGRHQGAMEAQAMYLMGVAPEWNARGAVDRLRLIPEGELGRPRVNVVFTVSGLYRDGLADKIILLDRASRLAASAGDNAISRQNRDVKKALLANGVAESDADELAGARVFTTAPGAYGFGLSQFVEQSRDKDEPETMAQLYLSKMNHVYTEKTWGRSAPKLLENQLRGNEAILHSRSSNLYGAVDNDDVYQWMGGLRVASESVGARPELLIHNMRRKGQEKIEDAQRFIATELNARNWNPKWIAEMQKEGYSGGRLMMRTLENLYGWQATAPESIAPEVWQKMYDVYVADSYKLGVDAFLRKSNPAAMQTMVARFLEVDRQGVYRFSTADREKLLREYSDLVSKNGVSCSANVCGNRKLVQAVAEALSSADSAKFREAFAKAWEQSPAVVDMSQTGGPASSRKVGNRGSRRKADRTSEERSLSVPVLRLVDFARAAKRAIDENPFWFAGTFMSVIGLGCLVAVAKRRRRAAWAELGLGRQ